MCRPRARDLRVITVQVAEEPGSNVPGAHEDPFPSDEESVTPNLSGW
jgi:hypothetical protein